MKQFTVLATNCLHKVYNLTPTDQLKVSGSQPHHHKMNKNAISSFTIPFSKMALNETSDIPCGQKTPEISDSPDRSEIQTNELNANTDDKSVSEILSKLRNILELRYNLATMKESFIFASTKPNKFPPFLQMAVDFKPYYGCMSIKQTFDNLVQTESEAFQASLISKLMELIDSEMQSKTKEFYETKNQFLNQYDIKEEKTGKIRTAVNTEAEKLLNEYKTERANYAKELNTPTSYKTKHQKEDKRKDRTKPYWQDKTKSQPRRENKTKDNLPFIKDQ